MAEGPKVCDICGKKAVETVTSTLRGVTKVTDLCKEHLKPVEEIHEAGSDQPRRGGAGGHRPTHKIIPID